MRPIDLLTAVAGGLIVATLLWVGRWLRRGVKLLELLLGLPPRVTALEEWRRSVDPPDEPPQGTSGLSPGHGQRPGR